ncbi:MAG TPA: histidine phosphatase family protein [Usitatibacter sp.]|nr:histidine phosphatase family protein [Usitatibacter sp.]
MPSRRGFLGALGALAAAAAARADDAPWERLRRGGLVILMRHASTGPGLGDPPGYRLDDCGTQRNLSEQGRAEARRVGERFRERRIPVALVLTSPWCRCRETARLAFGAAEDWEPLSSFFDRPDREADYSRRVKQRIARHAARKPAGNVVMVTHNVNIAALTGHSVGTAEMVLVRPDGCCEVRALERVRID